MTGETTTTPKPRRKPNPVARGAVVSPGKAFDHFGLLEHSLGNTDPGFWTADGVKTGTPSGPDCGWRSPI
jgi:hypothetical protein